MNKELDMERMPEHIAIILDGNGRWAKKRGLPRFLGHRKGAFNLRDIANECNRLGIKFLTVYCFSTENWKRPAAEVEYLMTQPIKYFNKYKKNLYASNLRLKAIGRRDRLPSAFLDMINEVEENTKDHTGLTLTLCIDYGSYDELTTAVKKIAGDIKNGTLDVDDITPQTITNNLFTASYPKLDLLIRTSGELRISNFLLWQLAYSELYFTNTYWPDFDSKELHKALIDFQSRDRRYGGLKK